MKRILFILTLAGLTRLTGCDKDDSIQIPENTDLAKHLPFIEDTHVTVTVLGTAVAGFNIIDDGGGAILTHGVCWSTSRHPTTDDNCCEGKCPYSNQGQYYITGLEIKTTYYLRAYASNSLGKAYGEQVTFTTPESKPTPDFNEQLEYGTMTDIDGNIYKTVKIGTQTWMAENLRTTRYNNGVQIVNAITGNLSSGAYGWYDNDSSTYKNLYGALYNHFAVCTGNLCPAGWHVPADGEWKNLEMTLGMSQASADTSYLDFDVYGMGYRGTDQGTRLKATSGWDEYEGRDGNGTNTSGFTALPAGDTDWYGNFEGAGLFTSWWCFGEPWARSLSSDKSKISRAIYYRYIGFSVRCVKD